MKRILIAASAAVLASFATAHAAVELTEEELIANLSIVNFDLTANVGLPLIEFDMNGDGNNDFQIIIRIGEDLLGTAEETGFSVNELATINIVNQTENLDAGIFVTNSDDRETVGDRLPVQVFSAGDSVGFETTSEPVFEALLYAEGELTPFASSDIRHEEAESGEPIEFTNGPFAEIGSTGFIGLFVVDPEENANFGFAEITRGSITVGNVGVQTINNAPAPIQVSAVPVPPALGLLVGALALFGFIGRRRKTV